MVISEVRCKLFKTKANSMEVTQFEQNEVLFMTRLKCEYSEGDMSQPLKPNMRGERQL